MKNILHRSTLALLLNLVMLAAITTINSCGCKPDDPSPADYRIKTTNDKDLLFFVPTTLKVDEWQFSYTPNNYLSGCSVPIAPSGFLFNYKPNSVEIMGYQNIALNAQGYRAKGDKGGTLTYDSDKHITQESNMPGDPNTTANSTWQYGNLTKFEVVNAGNVLLRNSYTYTDIVDTRQDGLDWYFGKRSHNLVKEIKSNGLMRSDIYTYSYVFDTRGRVTAMTIKMKAMISGAETVRTYTYSYFN
ncbi:MAG: hypothetical protein U0V74_05970 [Chitinophagales bacterium]